MRGESRSKLREDNICIIVAFSISKPHALATCKREYNMTKINYWNPLAQNDHNLRRKRHIKLFLFSLKFVFLGFVGVI